ncbi:hypothetical protein BDV26DRAFT_279506 [Aspergillus bertholletiae]|uniref:Protein kinase domain-containing protein n=1 Tax=Aspergillus bertholletiae TaxID=1226010 RepID=A0A5N7BF88_9EURO|nr:hypothetical protein BDV26DRAFT_279506 [Aspergillus bertholletiae]
MESHDCKPSSYCLNDTLTIQSHNPPPQIPRKWDQSLSPTELCLQNPPLSGSDGNSFVSIKLSEELQIGLNKRSQIFVVKCVNSLNSSSTPTDQDLGAKIYDPFYHDFEFDDEDSFFRADYEYTHEYAAYIHLSDLQGSVIPRFFGSCTLKIEIDKYFRLVRLILVENIDGLSMDRLNPEEILMEERQHIMKPIVDGESSHYTRNVMVKGSDAKMPRIVIIDLGMSVTGRSRNPSDNRDESRYFPGVAISPLLRWNIYYRRHAFTWLKEKRTVWLNYDRMREMKPPLPI